MSFLKACWMASMPNIFLICITDASRIPSILQPAPAPLRASELAMAASVLPSSEATMTSVRPRSPIRIDWASLQSSSGGDSTHDYSIERDAFRTPPPPSSNEEISSKSIMMQARRSPVVYEIATLMKYRASLAGITVFAKIKLEALNGDFHIA